MSLSFRRLTLDELDSAYTIVREANDWLRQHGFLHWLIPYDAYRQRQIAGANYGLFRNGELAVVVTLCWYEPLGWDDHIPQGLVMWLATLITAQKFRGQRLGEAMLKRIDAYLIEQGVRTLYLDCYYDFLPDYYAAHGFEYIARRNLVFSDGSLHDSVLMQKHLTTKVRAHE